MDGKTKCSILKQIRNTIARNNGIDYEATQCSFQGQCSGTCPKCEAELQYLEKELSKRRKAGKAIAVAGIAAALVVGSTGCAVDLAPESELVGDVPYYEEQTEETTEDAAVCITEPEEELILGEVPTEEILMGDVPLEE